jgi:microcystin-dependent protein
MSTYTVAPNDDILTSEYNNLRIEMPQPGMIVMQGSGVIPTGWLLCNGQDVSRTTYADLFAIIGTSFGGLTIDTFQVPDIRDRHVIGIQTYTMNQKFGGSFNILEDQLPSHTHLIPAVSHSDHGFLTAGSSTELNWAFTTSLTTYGSNYSNTSYAGTHTHTGATNQSGSGATTYFDVVYLAVNFLIKY